jgi:hypothetical protein
VAVRSLRQTTQLQGRVVGADGQIVTVTAGGPAEAERLGDLLRDQREVLAGRMSGEDFRDKWGGRRVGGVRLSGDADRMVVGYRQDPTLADVRYQRQGGRAA